MYPHHPHSPLPRPFAAVGCPTNSAGTNLPAGDCTAVAGYYGSITATTVDPFYETDGTNGAIPQPCTSQVGCETDTAMTCTTGADETKLQCTTLEPGYTDNTDFMVSAVACPANSLGNGPGDDGTNTLPGGCTAG